MDRLLWQSAKAQLYLTEREYVKRLVGRERIKRNKDAYRELGSLQDILSDLHQTPLSFVDEAEAKRARELWQVVQDYAAQQGVTPEVLLGEKFPEAMLRLVSSSDSSSFWHHNSGAASVSTRAPSSCPIDDLSVPAEPPLALLPSRLQTRGSPDFLDAFASELKEQLDLEFKSLLASIEEVQHLLEAEVTQPLGPIETRQFVLRLEQAAAKAKASAPCNAGEVVPVRWADLASDSDEKEPQGSVAPSNLAATAACSCCQRVLRKQDFSRRAWRQVRGLGAHKAPEAANCRACSA